MMTACSRYWAFGTEKILHRGPRQTRPCWEEKEKMAFVCSCCCCWWHLTLLLKFQLCWFNLWQVLLLCWQHWWMSKGVNFVYEVLCFWFPLWNSTASEFTCANSVVEQFACGTSLLLKSPVELCTWIGSTCRNFYLWEIYLWNSLL